MLYNTTPGNNILQIAREIILRSNKWNRMKLGVSVPPKNLWVNSPQNNTICLPAGLQIKFNAWQASIINILTKIEMGTIPPKIITKRIKHWQPYGKDLTTIHLSSTGKNTVKLWMLLKKLKIDLTYDQPFPLLWQYVNRSIYPATEILTPVYCCSLHNIMTM